ncbi:glycosyltransferase family 4 protein [Notoacmeibacter marinus]|uniref:glycosyltransferase family 4 protein n=1 Tax=Notoacmeibacter marinus TaxID=1876515 RepID=UPI0013B054BA|nr:glycosyltransferase family 4 protein [Notoacmeibacter marinus]
MRVVIATQHFPPRFVGGVEIYSEWLARALARRGFDVIVVALEEVDRKSGPSIEVSDTQYDSGIRVLRLSMLERDFWTFEASFFNRPLERWFEQKLSELAPDIVHIQSGHRLSAAPLSAALSYKSAQVVATLHDYWYVCPTINLLLANDQLCDGRVKPDECASCTRQIHAVKSRWSEDWMVGDADNYVDGLRFRSALLRDLLQRADLVLCPSRSLADTYLQAGFCFRRLEIVRLGLDPEIKCSAPSNKILLDPLRIGFIGSIAYHKGVHVLTNAVEEIHSLGLSCQCMIYGSSTNQPEYAIPLLNRYSGHSSFEFMGEYSVKEIGNILSDIDIVAVPSIWPENSPLVILQSLACGIPVIASHIGGMGEFIINGTNGLLCQPNDAMELARKIGRLIKSPDLLYQLGRGSKYERTSDDEVSEILKLYSAGRSP